jgi:hypothetical protein
MIRALTSEVGVPLDKLRTIDSDLFLHSVGLQAFVGVITAFLALFVFLFAGGIWLESKSIKGKVASVFVGAISACGVAFFVFLMANGSTRADRAESNAVVIREAMPDLTFSDDDIECIGDIADGHEDECESIRKVHGHQLKVTFAVSDKQVVPSVAALVTSDDDLKAVLR